MWLPVWSEWQEQRVRWVRAAHAGMVAAGAEARLDRLGRAPHAIELLRVRTPFDDVEAAEDWLLQLVQPLDDAGADWAGDVSQMLTVRWPEYDVWRGAGDDEFLRRIERLPPPPEGRRYARFFTVIGRGEDARKVAAFPRGLSEIVRCLPGVRIVGPAELERPHEWVAIDTAHDASSVPALHAFEHGLQARGFTTCRYDCDGAGCVRSALTIHAGPDTLDRLEARLAIALRGETAPWRKRYVPWSWSTGLWIHVAPDSAFWQLREWLEAQLGGAYVDAAALDRDFRTGGVLKVGATYVDRALELLAARGA